MKVTDFIAKRKQIERDKYKDLVLDAWDRLFPGEKQAQQVGSPKRLDTDADVRRKARQQL